MAPAKGGSVALIWGGESAHASLVELDTAISERSSVRHDVRLAVEISPIDGVAALIALDTTPSWNVDFPDARLMLFEPVSGSGTYLIDDTSSPYTVHGGGIVGLWLGAAVAPWSSRRNPNHLGDWRLEGAVRTGGSKNSMWAGPVDSRGAAPGGSAFRLAAAFSKSGKAGSPWIRAVWHRESGAVVDLTDDEGVVVAPEVALRPASTVTLAGGVELLAHDVPEEEERFAVDLHLAATYRTWEDVGSGTLLPNTLDPGHRIPVTHGDGVLGSAGVGFVAWMGPSARLNVALDGRIESTARQEHIYPVVTSGTPWAILWTATFAGRAKLSSGEITKEPEPVEAVPLPWGPTLP